MNRIGALVKDAGLGKRKALYLPDLVRDTENILVAQEPTTI